MIPTPTPFTPDGNYTVSPWTDYYIQTMNETLSNQLQVLLDIQVALLIVGIFIIGLLLTWKLRGMIKW
jgi:hypothetical protein